MAPLSRQASAKRTGAASALATSLLPVVLHLCYALRTASTTSSFRIDDGLRRRLEQASARLQKGKNWILLRALEEYLDRSDSRVFLAEARRQSLLASRPDPGYDEAFWEHAADESAWT